MTYRKKVIFYTSTQDTHYDSYVHLPKIMAFDTANFVFMCRFATAHWESDLVCPRGVHFSSSLVILGRKKFRLPGVVRQDINLKKFLNKPSCLKCNF